MHLQVYMMSQIAKAVTFTTAVIVLVGCSLYSQRYLGDLIEHGLSLAVFGELVIFMMPTLMVLILPVTLCGSIIFIYGKMIGDNEITVARACGVGQYRLLLPALIIALVATAIGYAMSLYFIPYSFSRFKDIQALVQDAELELLLREQTFNSFGADLTIYFRERRDDGTLENVLIYDNRNPNHSTTVIADQAVMSQAEDLLTVTFLDGNLQRRERDGGDLSIVYFDSYNFEFDTSGLFSGPSNRQRSLSERHIHELLDPPMETEEQRAIAGRMLAEGHQRLTSPLLCLTVTFMAGCAMFTGQYRRGGHKLRLALVGLLVAVLLIAYQVLVLASATMPVLLPFIYVMVVLPALVSIAILYVSDRFAPGRRLHLLRRAVPTPS
jgi:lipopolysaccharide export system permease protein